MSSGWRPIVKSVVKDEEVRSEFSFSQSHLFMHVYFAPLSYVKIYLLPDKSQSSKMKTTVIKNTTDPIFQESLQVRTLGGMFIHITFWDGDGLNWIGNRFPKPELIAKLVPLLVAMQLLNASN